jgi:tripartite-type tricarboxylate transporter receptor subunit TctC
MNVFKGLMIGAATFAAIGTQASIPAVAQAYPTQTVKIVVPFGAGSITDTLARILAERLGNTWKQQVIVENRPGLPGTTAVAKADKDGYTIMMTSNGHTIARTINKNVQFDPVADFSGITRVVETPFTMIVQPSFPAKTLKEFLDLAKANPGKYNFSSAGVASATFLVSESFRQAAKLDLVHVPFKSVPEAVTAALRGDVAFYFAPITDAAEQTAGGKVRSLAVTSPTRLNQVPDLPTVAEAGVPGWSGNGWFGLMAPAGTPRAAIDKISKDVADILKQTEVASRIDKLGSLPAPTSPVEFDKIIAADAERYAKMLANAGANASTTAK